MFTWTYSEEIGWLNYYGLFGVNIGAGANGSLYTGATIGAGAYGSY